MNDRLVVGAAVVEVVEVTPELARKWLGENTRNRSLSRTTSVPYHRDMTVGRWLFTGDPIRFGSDGRLLDGQHRLSAMLIAADDVPDLVIPMIIVSNLDPDVQNVMDTGRARAARDMLTINGMSKAGPLSALTRLAVCWERGIVRTSRTQLSGAESKVTHSEVLDAVTGDESLTDAVLLRVAIEDQQHDGDSGRLRRLARIAPRGQ